MVLSRLTHIPKIRLIISGHNRAVKTSTCQYLMEKPNPDKHLRALAGRVDSEHTAANGAMGAAIAVAARTWRAWGLVRILQPFSAPLRVFAGPPCPVPWRLAGRRAWGVLAPPFFQPTRP